MTTSDLASRILLIDDDESIRRDYGRALRSLGFVVDVAADGREAVDLLREKAFDTVISDINMPHMGGMELLRAVRERDLDVPVMLMTGDPCLSTASKAL